MSILPTIVSTTALIVMLSLIGLFFGIHLPELNEAEAVLLSDHRPAVAVTASPSAASFGITVDKLGDLDGDGTVDFVAGNFDNTIQLTFMHPNGTTKKKVSINANTPNMPSTIEGTFSSVIASAGDRNRDGTTDLVALSGLNYFLSESVRMHFIYLNPDGSVKSSVTTIPPGGRQLAFAIADIGDLDGDGIGDIAISYLSDTFRSISGIVQILFMNADDTVRTDVILDKNTRHLSDIAGLGQFGFEVQGIGDLNGDGTREIAVGATNTDDTGAVYILFMDPSGSVDRVEKIGRYSANVHDLTSGSQFGTGIERIGDIDGDGVEDIAVGASASTSGGSLFIILLNADGSVKRTDEINRETYLGPNTGSDSLFGRSVAAIGDLYHDGSTTLAVGAPGQSRVHLVNVNVNRPSANGAIDSHTTVSEVNFQRLPFHVGDDFGWAGATLPDLDGNGVLDVAVGAPGLNDGKGSVYIVYMGRYGTPVGYDIIDDSTTNGPDLSDDDWFGSSVAVDDWDGDGIVDLAVGAPGDDAGGTNRGTVHIVLLNSDVSVKGTIEINSDTFSSGILNYDRFGSSVLAIGDVDSNGVPDLAVGWPRNNNNNNDDEGAVSILRLDGNLDVMSDVRLFDQDIFSINGDDMFGASLALVDGLADGVLGMAVGAPGTWDDHGAVHVVALKSDDTPDSVTRITHMTNPDPLLSSGDMFGSSLTSVGDVDGNGVTDLMVTGTGEDGDDAGIIHLILLNANGTAKSISKVPSGVGVNTNNDEFGTSILAIDDLDGDGTAELLVGAPGRENRGTLHVLYTNADQSIKRAITLDRHLNMKPGIKTDDRFGRSVALVGDIDGNGVPDIAVGSPGVHTGSTLNRDKGAVHILFMGTDGTFSHVSRIDDNTARSPTLTEFDEFGISVAGIGDLDRDGTVDLAVGAHKYGGSDRGALFILFMNSDGSVNRRVSIGHNTANGPDLDTSSRFGTSVAMIGDIDRDGTVDLAVGASGHGNTDKGALFILFMNSDGSVKQTQKITQGSGNGPRLDDYDGFGSSVAPIGDLDGNGAVDIAVGAVRVGPGHGAAYLLFMNADGTANKTAVIGHNTPNMPLLKENVYFGSSVAGAGDLDGDGVPDIVVGAPGDDSWGEDTGVAYAIFLNSDGTITGTRIIDRWTQNMPQIVPDDMFGSSIASLGDLNGDGMVDLAVGAKGAGGKGDMHILFLDKSTIVTEVSSPRPDGRYTEIGTPILMEAIFSEPVTVTGIPQLELNIVDFNRAATYLSGSGGTNLIFGYQIHLGDASSDFDYRDSFPLFLDSVSSIKAAESPHIDIELKMPEPGKPGSLSLSRSIVVDAAVTGPIITLYGPAVQIVDLGEPYVELGAFTHDGSQVIIDSSGVDVGNTGRYAVSYTATDSSNRKSDVIRTVVVQQTHRPAVAVTASPSAASFGITVDKLGDLDGDGTVDFVAGNFDNTIQLTFMHPNGATKKKVSINANTTNMPSTIEGTFSSVIASAGDRNRDGTTDLVALSGLNYFLSESVRMHFIYLNPDGSVKSSVTTIPPGGRQLAFAIADIGDLDGDGIGDIAISYLSDTFRSISGIVQILFMNADDTVRTDVILDKNTRHLSDIAGLGQFGFEVQGIGDLNGDGTREIAVGATNTDDTGAVYILFMDPSGSVDRVEKIGRYSANVHDLTSGSQFGTGIERIGDIDGDGVEDIAVGASASTSGGSLFIILLNADGSVKRTDEINRETYLGPNTGSDSLFGRSVAAIGDLYHDGSTTLAVGAPGQSRVHLVNVNVNRPSANGAIDSHTTVSEVNFQRLPFHVGDDFGWAGATLPDLDGNGVLDVAVGAPGLNDGKGSVYIVYMGRYGTPVGYDIIDDSTTNGPDLSDDDWFGSSVAVDDWDGDGIVDLAVGAPGDDAGGTNRGTVHIVLLNSDVSVKGTIEINSDTFSSGILNYDRFGSSVLAIGDVDSNGVPDLAVGWPRNNNNNNDDEGAVSILRLDGNLDVMSDVRLFDQDIFSINGDDMFGASLALVDGLADGVLGMAVGAPGTWDDHGAVHVVALKSDDTPDSVTRITHMTNPDPLLSSGDMFGSSLTSVGDVDGNGVTDLMVTGTGEDGDDAGIIHLILLNANGTAKSISKVPSGVGVNTNNDEFGTSILAIDDLDGDGTAELLVGAPGRENRGTLHVLYTNADQSIKRAITLDRHLNMKPGIKTDDRFGRSVALVGDIDGNGVPDIAVGSPGVHTGSTLNRDKGAVHILFMGTDGTFSHVSRIDDNTARSPTLTEFDEFGISVAGIGDLDRDGTVDLAVGAHKYGGSDRGALFILFMNSDGSVNRRVSIGHNTANGPDLDTSSRFGTSVAMIGDIDRDGTVDLAVGASGHGNTNKGALFILFMNSDGSVKQTQKITQGSGNGPRLDDYDGFGSSVAPIGDLDGNGAVDIAVGAVRVGPGHGAAYLLFMNADGTVNKTAVIGHNTPNMPLLKKNVYFGSSVAGAGDLDGDGVPDIVVGAPGDDSWGEDTGVAYAIFLNSDGTITGTRIIDRWTQNMPQIVPDDMFGSSIASLGDLNGDGMVDLAVGAKGAGGKGDMHILFLDKSTIVTEVSSPRPDGRYTEIGTVIPIEMRFSEPVTVTGMPYLLMDVGILPRQAAYVSGSENMTLTFNYEIAAGDQSSDLDYAGTAALRTLPGISIKAQKSPGLDADLYLPAPAKYGSLSYARDIHIDTTKRGPIITLVGPSVQTVEIGEPYVELGAFTHDGSQVIIDSSGVDVGNTGRYTVSYTATDSSNKKSDVIRTVVVQQTHRPAVAVTASPSAASFGITVDKLGDLDGDGTVDFVAGNFDNTIQLTFMHPNGTTKKKVSINANTPNMPSTIEGTFSSVIASAGDRNRDGTTDLVALSGLNYFLSESVRMHFIYLNPDGSVKSSVTTIPPGGRQLAFAIADIGDLDGDGIGDIAISYLSDTFRSISGIVQILFMNADDTVRTDVILDKNTRHLSDIAGLGQFGFEVQGIGDLNGDGTREIAVGAANTDDTGAVYILFMDPSGSVDRVEKIGRYSANVPDLTSGSQFGTGIERIGDIDGDGVEDIAVGASASTSGGSLFIILLNADGSVKRTDEINRETYLGPNTGSDSLFGRSVAAIGDLYHDGSTTLAVGAPGQSRVHLVNVNVNRPSANGAIDSHTTVSEVNFQRLPFHVGDDFGWAGATLPDLDGNGVLDVAVGAPGLNDGKGSVYIVYMGRYGTPVGYDIIDDSTTNGPDLSDDDWFGSSVAVDDWDGDGIVDLAVGAPGDDAGGTNRGTVHIVLLNSDVSVKGTIEINSDTFSSGILNYDRFGSSVLAIGDVDSNGVPDLAVGWPRNNNNNNDDEGAVSILRLDGNLDVMSDVRLFDQDIFSINGDDMFGASLALVDGLADGVLGMAVGAPGTWDDHGAVHVVALKSDDTPDSVTRITHMTNPDPLLSSGDMFGSSLTSVGDVDGNGVTDLMVTGTGEDGDDAGIIHLILLNANGTAKSISKVPSGVGVNTNNDEFGTSILAIDDLDGDGTAELLVGAPGRENRGTLHVLYTNADQSIKRAITLDRHLNMKPGIKTDDRFGRSVALVGDIDGNGVPDIAVGSPGVHTGSTLNRDKGAVHILFMGTDGTFSHVSRIDDNTARSPTLTEFDEFGISVAGIGDLDRDGTVDLAVGAHKYGGSDRGALFILFMNSDGSVNRRVSIGHNTANGPDLDTSSRFGTSVAMIGDIDRDGTVDLAVGASGHGNTNKGALFILFMNSDGSVKQTQKITQGSGNGPRLDDYDGFGSSVAPIGDLDGNGAVDIAVGAVRVGPGHGAAYLLFMNADGTANKTAVIGHNTPNMPLLKENVYFGSSVAGAGDLDGDGVPDIVVGAPGDDSWGEDTGVAYAIFLNSDGTITGTRIIDRWTQNMPQIVPDDMFGSSIASLGDLNGDGMVDLAVGAKGAGGKGDMHILFLDKSTIVTEVSSPRPDGRYTEIGTVIPIEMRFSEPVTVTGMPYLLMDVGILPRQAAYVSGSENMTLTFNYEIAAGDQSSDLDYAGTAALRTLPGISIKAQDAPNLDAELNLRPPRSLGSLSYTKDIHVNASRSGLPPATVPTYNATVTSLNVITLYFSEPVGSTDSSAGWSLHGADSSNLSVISAVLDASGIGLELLLDASVANTAPEMFVVYDSDEGDMLNAQGHEPENGISVQVADGLPPTYQATISSDIVNLRFSENVDTGLTNGQGWTLSGSAVSGIRVAANTDPEGLSNIMTLELSESLILASGTAFVEYSPIAGDVLDLAGNALGTSRAQVPVNIPVIEYASVMALNQITVVFSEPINASSPLTDAWSLGGPEAGDLKIESHTDPTGLSNVMNLTLSGDLPDTGPEITLMYTQPAYGGLVDATGNRLETHTEVVLDGLAPVPEFIRAQTSRQIEIHMSEPVFGSIEGPNGFALESGGLALLAINSLGFSGSTIFLHLAEPLPEDSVTLSYDESSGDINDAAESLNALESFSAHAVDTSSLTHLFVTTWSTDMANQTVTIPIGLSSASFDLNWGDGTFERNVTGVRSHKYEMTGTYEVSIYGNFERIRLNNQQPNADRLISIEQWGTTRWYSMANAFAGASNMVYNASDVPDLSQVTNMRQMFASASSFNGEISAWNVSQVTNMRQMFASASSFNGEISAWNVSQVTNMRQMFASASSFNQTLNGWDVSRVTDMDSMFENAAAFNGEISSWDVSRVTDMDSMFENAVAFNGEISSWDVSGVTDMDSMLDGATTFRQNLGSWYITLNSTMVNLADSDNVIGSILAQNTELDGQNPTYGKGTGGNSDLFVVNSASKTLELDLDEDHYAGTYLVNITSTGEYGTGNHRMVNVTVIESNENPVLVTIGPKSVNELNNLMFTAMATDGDDDALTFSLTGVRPSGAFITSSGAFSWMPLESQDGPHRVTVHISDGNDGSDSEIVTVTVNEVNVAPMLDAIGLQSASEMIELAFTATATDDDIINGTADSLEFSLGSGAPIGAFISAAGEFSWTPMASQVGMHTVTVQVTDGNDTSDSEDVEVMVVERGTNLAPVLDSIGPQSVNELNNLMFTAMATDGDDDALTFSLTGVRPSGAFITSSGAFSWMPLESQDGPHRVTVHISDGNDGSDSEIVTVTVNEVNVAPMLDAIGLQSASEMIELAFTATATDDDIINGTADSLEFSLGSGAPIGAFISAAGEFSWTPMASQVGMHTVTVQVTDGNDTSDSEDVEVMVVERGTNLAPVLDSIGPQSVNELNNLMFTAMATDGDDDALTFSLTGVRPSGAFITSSGAFSWMPLESQDGPHRVTVHISDGNDGSDSEIVTVTVNEVNVAPMLDAIGLQSASEMIELAFTATATDDDIINGTADSLEFSLGSGAPIGAFISAAGEFSWTPMASQVGMHTVTVQVTDGNDTSDSEDVEVMVVERGTNLAPVLDSIGPQNVNELNNLMFTAMATDGDDDALTFSLTGVRPSGAFITSSGAFSWMPLESQDGPHRVTVHISDGNDGSDSEIVTVTVNEVNVAPMLDAIGLQSASEMIELAFTATATDDDIINGTADSLEFSLGSGAPIGAFISAAGEFSWTPMASQVGMHTVTVQVTDGNDTSDSEDVEVMVVERGTNLAPVLDSIGPQSVNELNNLTFTATATDGDDDALTFSLTGVRPRGASISSAGSFSWTPDQSQDGTYFLKVTVSDGGGGIDYEVVEVTVHDIGPMPVSARASSSAITLTLSEVVTTDAQPPSGFSVSTRENPITVESVTGSGTTMLTLGLNGTISRTDEIKLDYLETAGDVADLTDKPLKSFSDLDVSFTSSRSRSSYPPPAITVGSPGYPDSQIPQWVMDAAGLEIHHDLQSPIAQILVDNTFDFPLEIDGQGYLLRSAYSTLVPHTVTVGSPTQITFTVYTQKEIMHFALYLNMQGQDTNYHDSDTYVAYDGRTHVTDPHGYLSDVTITVTDTFEEQQSEKRIVHITLEFAAPMGPTSMVVYTWDTDRRSTVVRIIDALDVMATADPEPGVHDPQLPADPEPGVHDPQLPADPEPTIADTLLPNDDDDDDNSNAQTLHIIRMWSGFELELLTDAQLIDALGLTDYAEPDLPNWMITNLGVLAANGEITVDEFVTALKYVLENL